MELKRYRVVLEFAADSDEDATDHAEHIAQAASQADSTVQLAKVERRTGYWTTSKSYAPDD